MQTQTMVESKACGIALYSTPHIEKLRTYEHSTRNNNFGYIIEEPHPDPPEGEGVSREFPPLWGGDCVIAQEMAFLVSLQIYMRKYLNHFFIMSYSLPFGEG
jgi:hypothetical protein